jgi:6-phosphogluconolactonase (cycloisomerase 2 family)
MKTPLLLALPALAAAAIAFAPGATAGNGGGGAQPAVFVQTNDPAGNTILAYTRAGDGTLSAAGSYATGGEGAVEDGAVADTLASQGSLVYDSGHELLFAVNAGSDSLSIFAVDGATLSLSQVVPSGGSFPSSVAVHGNLVYVLNAGGAGSVQGFRITGNHLTPLHDGSRSLGLSNADTPNFLSSPGQVGFSPDGSRLLVTTKASTSEIDVFGVAPNGRLSDAPVANASATLVPFGFVFDPAGRLVVAEAGTSTVSTYTLGADGALTDPQSLGDGQAALCWIASAGGFFYASNTGSGNVSGYVVDGGGQPSLLGTVASTPGGPIDAAASSDGAFLYVQTGVLGDVDGFHVESDGSLTSVGSITGLPAGMEGIAAT